MEPKVFLVAIGALFTRGALGQFTQPPPTTADPNTIKDCTWWHVADTGDTCESVRALYDLSAVQFVSYNPSLASSCKFILGNSYCVEQNYGLPPPVTSKSTSTSTSAAPTTTTGGNGVTTPKPTQSGMVNNCNKFHLVESGDSCAAIQSTYNIPAYTQLFSWNPALGNDCQFLAPGNYICVGVMVGSGSITTTPPPQTTPTNGVTTPTPTQSGMVNSCNKFHLVKAGDSCAAIQSTYGLTNYAQLFGWNPALGNDCQFLSPGNYICVGVVRASITTTTTLPGNGINTPSPIQTGMTTSCNKFHLVQNGDSCAAIQSTYGVGSFADLFSWNPALGNDCQFLLPGNYICVGVLGSKPITTATKTQSNGVATPTPTQPGMVTNCRNFHKVVDGDTCQAVADRYRITLADFTRWNSGVGSDCRFLQLGSYACVGLI